MAVFIERCFGSLRYFRWYGYVLNWIVHMRGIKIKKCLRFFLSFCGIAVYFHPQIANIRWIAAKKIVIHFKRRQNNVLNRIFEIGFIPQTMGIQNTRLGYHIKRITHELDMPSRLLIFSWLTRTPTQNKIHKCFDSHKKSHPMIQEILSQFQPKERYENVWRGEHAIFIICFQHEIAIVNKII